MKEREGEGRRERERNLGKDCIAALKPQHIKVIYLLDFLSLVVTVYVCASGFQARATVV